MRKRIIEALTGSWDYAIEWLSPGRLTYREGNREYIFPAYAENGVLVVVAETSSQRLHLFFSSLPWHEELSESCRRRILGRIRTELEAQGILAKVLERAEEEAFVFHPELFEDRSQAAELLADAGREWFRDYSSIDLVHGDYGLEVCGIREERQVRPIIQVLQAGFPHWHHCRVHPPEPDGEAGWSVSVSMFRPRSCTPGQCDSD